MIKGGNFLDYNVLTDSHGEAHNVHAQELGILWVEAGVGITTLCWVGFSSVRIRASAPNIDTVVIPAPTAASVKATSTASSATLTNSAVMGSSSARDCCSRLRISLASCNSSVFDGSLPRVAQR